LTVVFVDVRGSTSLAEHLTATEFSTTLNRFYEAVTAIFVRRDGFIDKFVGDEVMAVFLPIFAGRNYARQAIIATHELLCELNVRSELGSDLSIGIGVHTGPAFFGTVTGADGAFSDFTALGDTVNTAARLVALAGPGEALISEASYKASKLDPTDLDKRTLELKGRSEPISVRITRTPSYEGSVLAGNTAPEEHKQ
jgi:adenylate cyclase